MEFDNKKILKLYADGKSGYEVMNELGIDINKKNEVYSIIKKAGLTRSYRECHQPNFNRNFFSEIDSHEKAYLLGFLYADGCVHSHNMGISLALHKKDKEILEYFQKFLNLDATPSQVKGKNTLRLEWQSVIMKQDLIKRGCVPKKSLILTPPTLKEDLRSHFIRGYFDGDGSIYKRFRNGKISRFCIEICGTKKC